ncbi:MAG: 16S rRNA processing protein RimM [Bacilli bacterium]|nr:16S rRNA processing protein RimM [Bacilli bacterium]
MNKVYIGKIVNTHGVKGELRIRSDFEFKDKVFIVNNKLIINDKEYNIRSYRKHKTFDMVCLDEYNNINDVLFLVGSKVYFDKDKLDLSNEEEINKELFNYKIIINGVEGKLLEIIDTGNNKVLRVLSDIEHLVPYNDTFVKIDRSIKEININLIDGM